jgi:beta-phosphoglucomutase family hydrolase
VSRSVRVPGAGTSASARIDPAGRRSATQPAPSLLDGLDAVIFDTDGVVTDTARVHAAAWKQVFDEFLSRRATTAAGTGEDLRPFEVRADYLRYVDGKPRLDGVRGFLQARGIALPEGGPDDPPDRDTVYTLGARKDAQFVAEIERTGVTAFPSTVALVRELHRRGLRLAVVSASRHCAQALRAAGVDGLFDVRVDGLDADRLGLPGKPDPALFLAAARRLGIPPGRAAVVEDALAGVAAGRRGGFGLVIGVDRGGQGEALRRQGADLVVSDLAELRVDGRAG